ncbi:MAG: hypothetical protein GTO18_08330 [Anaerolineales bacterium]|nr:hypothetical protein [Anaerolineales bacterium]
MLINLLADTLPFYRRPARLQCLACSAPRPPVAWSGLIGVLTGHRACLYCGVQRGWRSPIVEIVLIISASLLYYGASDPLVFVIDLFVVFVYTLIIVTDIEHRLILHVVTFPSAIIIGLVGSLDLSKGPGKTLLGGLVGFGGFLLLYFMGGFFASLMGRLRGRPVEEIAFGFGDVTLAGLIGLTVGFPGVIVALVIGILLAGLFSLLYILSSLLLRRYNPFMPIPYGPFLVLGCLFIYFDGGKILQNML